MTENLPDLKGLTRLFETRGSFSLPTDRVVLDDCLVIVDETEATQSNLDFWYDRHGESHFEWTTQEKSVHEPFKQLIEQDPEYSVTLHGGRKPIEMLCVQTKINQEGVTLRRFRSQRMPIISEYSDSAASIELILLNGPELSNFNRPIYFETANFKIKIEEYSATNAMRKERLELRKDCIPTARVEITSSSSKNLENGKFWKIIFLLSEFFTLIRGGHCGLGHGLAKNIDRNPAFCFLDFTRNDQFHLEQNWYSRNLIANLNELFSKFLETGNCDVDGKVFRRAISYYRAANITAIGNRESGLITGFAALELLTTHVLRTRGGWTENLLSTRTPVSDKMAASCAILGLTADPFEHSNELAKLANSQNKLNMFQLLAKFRNHLVHQTKEFVFDGMHLREIWEVNQWLVELHLLFLLDYRGEMADRRNLRGWEGETVEVPLVGRSQ